MVPSTFGKQVHTNEPSFKSGTMFGQNTGTFAEVEFSSLGNEAKEPLE